MDSVNVADPVPIDLSLLSGTFDEVNIVGLGSNDDDEDEKLALKLQIQEVLVCSAVNSATTNSRTGTVSRNSSQGVTELSVSKKIYCGICERIVPSIDLVPQATCSHALCSMCLHHYVDKMLQINEYMVLCSHEGCNTVLEPELFREFIPPRLFNRWISAPRYETPREELIQISKQIVNSENRGKESAFQVNHGIFLELSKVMDGEEGKLIDFPGSVKEVGECSTNVDNQIAPLEFYCSICMENKNFSENFAVGICFHRFCVNCVKNYIAANVEENVLVMKCPDPVCKRGALDPEMCRRILPESIFDRWGIALCESALGTKKFYCPFKECSGLLEIGEDYEAITNAECPHCYRMFCAQCRVPWHDGIDCDSFQRLGEDERGREDIMFRNLATKSKWQRCPRCMMFVEKIDGCMFMQCRCGHCFCYVCATEMSKEYHYCTKCLR